MKRFPKTSLCMQHTDDHDWLVSLHLLAFLYNEGNKKAQPKGGGNMSKWIKQRTGDRYGFAHVCALLNDDKPNSCCFRSPAKLSTEPWGLQTGISDLLWNQTLLQLLQTRSFITDLQQRALCNNCTDRCCSLPFTPAWGCCISHQTLNPKGAHLARGWATIDKYCPSFL